MTISSFFVGEARLLRFGPEMFRDPLDADRTELADGKKPEAAETADGKKEVEKSMKPLFEKMNARLRQEEPISARLTGKLKDVDPEVEKTKKLAQADAVRKNSDSAADLLLAATGGAPFILESETKPGAIPEQQDSLLVSAADTKAGKAADTNSVQKDRQQAVQPESPEKPRGQQKLA